jgi:hypothetical protein
MPAPEYLPVMRDVVCFVAVAICGRSGILSSCWGFGVAAMFRCSGIWSGFLWGVEVSYIASRPPWWPLCSGHPHHTLLEG